MRKHLKRERKLNKKNFKLLKCVNECISGYTF